MSIIKDKQRNTWRVYLRYKDYDGTQKVHTKRGFKTKKEARAYEDDFKARLSHSCIMSMSSFIALYMADIKPRLKMNTYTSKEYIINRYILPYWGNYQVPDINPVDIMTWQNELLKQGHERTFLKLINGQFNAIMNHAEKYYGLSPNPIRRIQDIGSTKPDKEMNFWTLEEYNQFTAVIDDMYFKNAFDLLYWCGIRKGELLALTPEDFDFEHDTVRINKSIQRIHKQDVVTAPKTRRSVRTLMLPGFLSGQIRDLISGTYKIGNSERLFDITGMTLSRHLKKYAEIAGIKSIRLHDLRHSHVALLINLGYSPYAIAERLGHESIEVTQRYAHLFPSVQKEMAFKLDSLKKEEN